MRTIQIGIVYLGAHQQQESFGIRWPGLGKIRPVKAGGEFGQRRKEIFLRSRCLGGPANHQRNTEPKERRFFQTQEHSRAAFAVLIVRCELFRIQSWIYCVSLMFWMMRESAQKMAS